MGIFLSLKGVESEPLYLKKWWFQGIVILLLVAQSKYWIESKTRIPIPFLPFLQSKPSINVSVYITKSQSRLDQTKYGWKVSPLYKCVRWSHMFGHLIVCPLLLLGQLVMVYEGLTLGIILFFSFISCDVMHLRILEY